jgi:hypothetical protein
MDELRAYVSSQVGGVPVGWTDDGTTLKAPNGMTVIQGFRARVLQGWDATNVPIENERTVNQVEHADMSVGAGSVQTFVNCRLGWTATKGVYMVPAGTELLFLEKQ